MAFFNEFPHSRTYDSDLGWLIWAMKKLIADWEDFSNTNSIKFADPITWAISKNYEPSTIVIDENGNGYISRKPVPAGIPLSNDEYWTQIFAFGDITNTIRENIALPNFKESATALSGIKEGDLFWWNNNLYISAYAFPAGTAIIPETNCNKITIESWVQQLMADLNETIVQQIAGVNESISSLQAYAEGTKNDLETLEEDYYRSFAKQYAVITEYGAVGDGQTDCTAAIQSAIDDETKAGIFIPNGEYLITGNGVRVGDKNGYKIFGAGTIVKNTEDDSVIGSCIRIVNCKNLSIEDIKFDGRKNGTYDNRKNTGAAILITSGSIDTNENFNICIKGVSITNWCGRAIHLHGNTASGAPFNSLTHDITIDSCYLYNVVSGVVQSIANRTTIRNCHIRLTMVETITIDNGSIENIVENCTLVDHYGGIGAIGSNQAQRCIITNNIIRRISSTITGDANSGIRMNGVPAPNGAKNSCNAIIQGNDISGFEYGMRFDLFNDAEQTISNSNITGNRILTIGTDAIYIQAAGGLTLLEANNTDKDIISVGADGQTADYYHVMNGDRAFRIALDDYKIKAAAPEFAGSANEAVTNGNIITVYGQMTNISSGTDFVELPQGFRPARTTRGYNCILFNNGRLQYTGSETGTRHFSITAIKY